MIKEGIPLIIISKEDYSICSQCHIPYLIESKLSYPIQIERKTQLNTHTILEVPGHGWMDLLMEA